MTALSLSRRDFLALGAVTAAAAAAGVLRDRTEPAGAPSDAVAAAGRRLGALVDDRDGVGDLGEAWLGRHPRRPGLDELVRAISPATFPEELARAGDADLRRLVASAAEDDYRAGRVVAVRGWLLSLTEARLCAICALA
jgi:hypothetical protein